jgi:sec-independent protein translocase protein TatA
MGFLGMPGGWEWIVILVIGLLLFGKRLPEIGRSVGRSIVEFKKGIKGIEDEVEQGAAKPTLTSTPDARRVSTSEKVEEGV